MTTRVQHYPHQHKYFFLYAVLAEKVMASLNYSDEVILIGPNCNIPLQLRNPLINKHINKHIKKLHIKKP